MVRAACSTSIAATLVLAICVGAAYERVDLRPRPAKGDEAAWVSEVSSKWQGAFGSIAGNSIDTQLRLKWTTKVAEIDAERIVINCDVTDVRLVNADGTLTIEYDSDAREKSQASPFAPVLNELLDAEIVATLDRNGVPQEIKGLSAASYVLPGRGPIRVALMHAVSTGAWSGMLVETFGAGGGKKEAGVGDTWSVETTRPLVLESHVESGVLTVVSKRKLESIGATLKCTQEITVNSGMESKGIRPDGSKTQSKTTAGKGEIELDAKDGIAIQVSSEWKTESTVKPDDAVEQTIRLEEKRSTQRQPKAEEQPKEIEPAEPPVRRFQ